MHHFINIEKKLILSLTMLPSNNNISFFWNIGSMLIKVAMIQISTGLFLAFLFTPSVNSFWELILMGTSWNFMFMLRTIHLNMASMFFLMIFIHMFRGLLFKSYKKNFVWGSGFIIYVILMAAAFLGYVLPWGQMSLWGCTVITNLFSVIHNNIVLLLWGGFSVSSPTLSLFFSLHFLLPLLLFMMMFFHIYFLHEMGSSSEMHFSGKKIFFLKKYMIKDMNNLILLFVFISWIMFMPWYLGDCENFIEANSLNSPEHIKPEWYFLWAYAILRAIHSKLGGVMALLCSVLSLFILMMWKGKNNNLHNMKMLTLVVIFILLTWIGGKPVESPYIIMSQIFSIIFSIIMLM